MAILEHRESEIVDYPGMLLTTSKTTAFTGLREKLSQVPGRDPAWIF